MRYNLDRLVVVSIALVAINPQAWAQGAQYPDPFAAPSTGTPGGSYPDPLAASPVENQGGVPAQALPTYDEPPAATPQRQDLAQYDDVGYASVVGSEYASRATASGEPFNPNSFNAGHAALPGDSYVEVTHLTTGKTILVRINDRLPNGQRHLISLTPAAAAALQINGPAPVRVRRVNPPDQEKSALANGQKGADRMNTPEALLVALRKKMGMIPQVAVAPAAAEAVAPKVATRRPVAAAPKRQRPGAHYEPVAPSSATVMSMPVEEVAPAPADFSEEYIVEDASAVPARVSQGARWSQSFDGSYFVQLGAFSDRQRAYSLAQRAGFKVQRAGTIYRVRSGPYANKGTATAALGALASKGYRGARVTR